MNWIIWLIVFFIIIFVILKVVKTIMKALAVIISITVIALLVFGAVIIMDVSDFKRNFPRQRR